MGHIVVIVNFVTVFEVIVERLHVLELSMSSLTIVLSIQHLVILQLHMLP